MNYWTYFRPESWVEVAVIKKFVSDIIKPLAFDHISF